MAAQVLKLQFDWENNVSFKMTSKLNEADAVIVVYADENAHFNTSWEHFKKVCVEFVNRRLDGIGNEMKAG